MNFTFTYEQAMADEYNNYPFSVLLVNEDGSARCAIKKRKTFSLFCNALKKAISEEIDCKITSLSIGAYNHKHYSAPVVVKYIDENYDEDEVEDKFTIETAAVY